MTISNVNFNKAQAILQLAESLTGALASAQISEQSVTGFLVGVGFNFPIAGETFSIQPELLYLQKGFARAVAIDQSGAQVKVEATTQFNYLEIPLLAKVAFGSESIKAYLNAGPSLGYGLGGTTKVKGTASFLGFPIPIPSQELEVKFGEASANYDEEKEIYFDNRIDLGLQFGGGVAFKVGPGSILLDARYGFGLSNLNKTPDPIPAGTSSSDYKSQSRTIALSLGYSIPLGGK